MADKKTEDPTSPKDTFVFGQRMDERVVKGKENEEKTSTGQGDGFRSDDGEENGLSSSESPVSVVSRAHHVPSTTSTTGPFGQFNSAGASKSNPFATKAVNSGVSTPNTSDSEEEKKEKPIIAPSSFQTKKAEENLKPRFFMKPSALDAHTAQSKDVSSSSSFRLKPATLKGPDVKSSEAESKDKSNSSEAGSAPDSTEQANTESDDVITSRSEAISQRLFGDSEKSTEKTFTPSSTSKLSNGSGEPGAKESGFVFGQNIGERAENIDKKESANSSSIRKQEKEPSSDVQPDDEPESTSSAMAGKSLEESAKEYTEKHAHPQYKVKVDVATGEEEESNVLQAHCKLYMFDKPTQTWKERGRGQLRLNDKLPSDGEKCPLQSRLVMRTDGSLRVILNTKVWPGMTVDRASPKSLRITAQDVDGIKVVLLMASPNDTAQICSAIDWRVQQLKAKHEIPASPQESVSEASIIKRRADTPEEVEAGKRARLNSSDEITTSDSRSENRDSTSADTTATVTRQPIISESEGSNESSEPHSTTSTSD